MRATASAGMPKRSNLPTMDSAFNDNGITVAGSVSNQRFVDAQWFATESHSEVIVLRLRGAVGQKAVIAPVTVKTRTICSTCGKSSRPGSEFCPTCGTALMMV